MSVNLESLDTRSHLATAFAPQAITASQTGTSFELPDGDGPVFALIAVGELDDEATLAVSFEESDTGSSWSAVAGSAVPGLGEASLTRVAVAKTKRYLRCAVALAGATPTASLAVLVGQGCKVF